MEINNDSLKDLITKVKGTSLEHSINFILAQTNEARLTAVQKSVDFACNLLIEHRDKKQGNSEDQLTVQICDMLSHAGIQAIHNASIGGNCDIVVKAHENFLWLAEAKIHRDYSWLEKGFKQLSTRYSTGMPGQDHGDILIYCFTENAKSTLDKWQNELTVLNPELSIKITTHGNPLEFNSIHTHSSSGLDFHTRHKILPLHWYPKDK